MICPSCKGETRVIDSREARVGDFVGVRRRRECLRCAARYTTYEIPSADIEAAKRSKELAVKFAALATELSAACRSVCDEEAPRPSPASIAAAFRSAREDAEKSAREVADLAGIHTTTVYTLEREGRASNGLLSALAFIYGRTLPDLFAEALKGEAVTVHGDIDQPNGGAT